MLIEAGVPTERILKVFGSMEDTETPARIVAKTVEKFGRIDVLVNGPNVQVFYSLIFSRLTMQVLRRNRGRKINMNWTISIFFIRSTIEGKKGLYKEIFYEKYKYCINEMQLIPLPHSASVPP